MSEQTPPFFPRPSVSAPAGTPEAAGAGSTAANAAGTTAHHAQADAGGRSVRVAVLTISDTRTPETDGSGQYLLAELRALGHEVVAYRVVRDDAVEIRTALVAFVREATIVISTGGTGIAGRDVTVPVVESLITKPIPGFGELFRMLSFAQVGGAAMLSRALAGLCRGSLIFALPGSLNAVQTAWEGLLKTEIAHLAFEVARQGQPGSLPDPSPVRSPAGTLKGGGLGRHGPGGAGGMGPGGNGA